jgi:hypothetical protein
VSAENCDASSGTTICLAAPGMPKCLSCARQTRHDRANRQVCDIRNLTIGELFDSQYFTERAGHRIENEANGLGFCFAYQHLCAVLAFPDEEKGLAAMDAYSRIELAPKDQYGVCVT